MTTLLAVVAALVVGACGNQEDRRVPVTLASPSVSSSPPVSPSTSVSSSPSTPPSRSIPPGRSAAPSPTAAPRAPGEPGDPGQARVDAARADLVGRFGYRPGDIQVVSFEPVTWPNSALGCPPNDAPAYTSGPVPGYRIVLRWGDSEFRYHGADSADTGPFLCQFLD